MSFSRFDRTFLKEACWIERQVELLLGLTCHFFLFSFFAFSKLTFVKKVSCILADQFTHRFIGQLNVQIDVFGLLDLLLVTSTSNILLLLIFFDVCVGTDESILFFNFNSLIPRISFGSILVIIWTT